MFPYQDPTGSNCLERQGALSTYRGKLNAQYETAVKIANTSFVPIRAFSGLTSSGPGDRVIGFLPNAQFHTATVSWNAFPRRKASVSNADVDSDRNLQEEYTEWMVQSVGGKLSSSLRLKLWYHFGRSTRYEKVVCLTSLQSY
jgi:hypothetical protein